MPRQTDMTVLASRDLGRARERLSKGYREETNGDPERGAVIASALMAVEAAEQAVLEINLYDERTAGR